MTEVRGIEIKAVLQEVKNLDPVTKKTAAEFIRLYEQALLLALLEQGDINEVQFQLCMDQLTAQGKGGIHRACGSLL